LDEFLSGRSGKLVAAYTLCGQSMVDVDGIYRGLTLRFKVIRCGVSVRLARQGAEGLRFRSKGVAEALKAVVATYAAAN
jgi:hypothetical protein